MTQTEITNALNSVTFPFTDEFVDAVVNTVNHISDFREIGDMISGDYLHFRLFEDGRHITKIFKQEDVFYVRSEREYKQVITSNGELMILTNFAGLKLNGFFRSHKKYLVNLRNVDSYQSINSKKLVIMKNGDTLPVSRECFKQLKGAL